jgi:Short C-terminal domain
MARDGSVMQFRCHLAGNNVRVVIYPDRIEWQRVSLKPPGGMTGLLLSGGMSLALPGRKDSNMIPIRMIQGLTTHRSGLSYTLVRIATAGDVTEFKVTRRQADDIKGTLLRLMQGTVAPPQFQPVVPPPTPQTSPLSVADELRKLAQLRDEGLISDQEFATQRARLLQ